MRKTLIAGLFFMLGCAIGMAQTDNTFYAKQFVGSNVGAKVSAAMAACSQDTRVPCIIVLDPSLATWPTGTMPTLCGNCSLADYRSGFPIGQSGGTTANVFATGLIATKAAVSNPTISFSAPPRAGYQMPPLNGFYYPVLKVANIPIASGLSNYTVTYLNGSGTTLGTATGVGATTAGTAGTGFIPLNQPLDFTVPGRLNFHVCIGSNTTSADTNSLKVGFTNSSGSAAYGVVLSGSSMTAINLLGLGGNIASNYGSTGGIPSYTCGSMFMDWIGNGIGGLDASGNEYVWTGWIPDNASLLTMTGPPLYGAAYTARTIVLENVMTAAVLANVTGLYISDASANSIVTGAYVSQGRLDGPTDNLMPTPGYISPIVLDDSTRSRSYRANLWIPYNYGTGRGNSIVEMFHPNSTSNVLDAYGSVVYPNLLQAGFIVESVMGDTGTGNNNAINGCAANSGYGFCAPNSSDLGSQSGNRYRNWMVGLTRKLLPNANQLHRFGMSMGGGDALFDEMLHPGGASIALFSPALNTTAAYSLSGSAPYGTYTNFSTNINNGWSSWYECITASCSANNPATDTTDYLQIGSSITGLPISYMTTKFNNRGSWTSSMTVNLDDIVALPFTGSISQLAPYDPNLNYPSFSSIPISAVMENQDSLIPSSWCTNFAAGVTAAGNPNASCTLLSDCTAGSGQSCHLYANEFQQGTTPPYNTTTNLNPTTAFFLANDTPFPAVIGAQESTQSVGGSAQPLNYATATAVSGGTATAVAPCTASVCQITFSGGTLTTGNILNLVWPTGTWSIIPICTATEQGNTSSHGLSSPLSGTTLTGVAVNAAVTVASSSFTIVVSCKQP